MFIAWDSETNGVRLVAEEEGGLKVSPRPVFFEELDLLRYTYLLLVRRDAARFAFFHRCLTFHAYGCVAAESAHVSAAVGARRKERIKQTERHE